MTNHFIISYRLYEPDPPSALGLMNIEQQLTRIEKINNLQNILTANGEYIDDDTTSLYYCRSSSKIQDISKSINEHCKLYADDVIKVIQIENNRSANICMITAQGIMPDENFAWLFNA